MIKVEQLWYQKRTILWPFIPLSFLFTCAIRIRRKLYQLGVFPKKRFPIPVVIIGNLTVGGTGKTPLVIHVAKWLAENGFKPGIISCGYKGTHTKPISVDKESDPILVGDEPVLLAKHLKFPILVAKNRVKAVRKMLQHYNVDIIISDDGLQHYALHRDIEVVVVDGQRRFGNGHCLPVGPLREPKDRLKSVDLIVNNGGGVKEGEFEMKYIPNELYQGVYTMHRKPLVAFKDQVAHAVAGIGNPNRFFQLLVSHGLQVIPHIYPDHHKFKAKDICFDDNLPVIMTEKDATKCLQFADTRHWVLPVTVSINPLFNEKLLSLIKGQNCG